MPDTNEKGVPVTTADLRPVVRDIKLRLQSQQEQLQGLEPDSYTRLAFRAELDALWAVAEVIAERVDGVQDVRVHDHFTESGKWAAAQRASRSSADWLGNLTSLLSRIWRPTGQ